METDLSPAANDPMDIVRYELAALRKEMQAAIKQSRITINGDKGALFEALAKAQSEFGPIHRTETARVRGEAKGSGREFEYVFSYAPLENVLAACVPALNKNGLWFSQPLASADTGGHQLRTWLCHASGAMIEVETDLPRTETIQKLGSAVTYLRRYVAQALLGVSADEDDDGNAADGNQRTKVDRPVARPTPSAAPPARQATVPAPPARPEPSPAPQARPAQGTVSSHGQERAEAQGEITQGTPKTEPTPPQITREPEGITAEQDIELTALYKKLKYGRAAAGDHMRKVLGPDKTPATLSRADAEKLLVAVRQLAEPAAQGAAS